MSRHQNTDRRAVLLAGAVGMVVIGLPWVGAVWTSGSLFGFPLPGFVLFLLAPALLVLIAGSGPWADTPDEGEGE